MNYIENLPAELLHGVCSYCPTSDIRSLRLTSRLLATIADEHFLDDVVVFFAREDFERAESIINGSRIAKNITSLTFQADRVPFLGPNFGLWNEFRKRSFRSIAAIERREAAEESFNLNEQTESVVFNKHGRKALQAAYEHYNRLTDDQNEMMLENRAEACVKHIFQHCKKLDEVVVAMNDHHPAWRSVEAFRRGMIHPCGDNATSRLNVRPLNEVLMAAYATGRKLSTLEVHPISFQFFAQDDERMKKIYEAITGLKNISLEINDKIFADREMDIEFEDDDDDETIAEKVLYFEGQAERESYRSAENRVVGAFRDGRLASFLSEAPLLECIAFTGIATHWPECMIPLEDILASSPWPAIKTLDLQYFQCGAQELADLILKYRESLQELRLAHVYLNQGDPGHFFQAIAGECHKLVSVEIAGDFASLELSYDFEYGPTRFKTAIQKYLKYGGVLPRISTFSDFVPAFLM